MLKVIVVIGTVGPINQVHQALLSALNKKERLIGCCKGVFEDDGRSQEVSVVQIDCPNRSTRGDWVIVVEETAEDLIKTPIGRTIAKGDEPDTIKIFVDKLGKCAPDAVERATKLLISCVCGTHPLGQRPECNDPHQDRYRKWWTPVRN